MLSEALESRLSKSQYAYQTGKSYEAAICRVAELVRSTEQSIMINFDLSRASERTKGSRVIEKVLRWDVHPALENIAWLLISRRQFKTEVRKRNSEADRTLEHLS